MQEKEDLFVCYSDAIALTELGFNQICLAFYGGEGEDKLFFNLVRDGSGDFSPIIVSERLKWIGVPTYQQAFDWLREKYRIRAIFFDLGADTDFIYDLRAPNKEECDTEYPYKFYPAKEADRRFFKSEQESRLDALQKLIELCKKQK